MTLTQPQHGHLSLLYLKWKDNPKIHGQEMAETIDKIIYSTIRKQTLEPIYKKFEDHEDLIQELRLLCLQKLDRIEDPTNKRIFNFLRISISLALKDKARKVGKLLDREEKEEEILGEKVKLPITCFCFGDQLLDNVATLLAHGETKQSICSILNISRTRLQQAIEKLKVIYHDKK